MTDKIAGDRHRASPSKNMAIILAAASAMCSMQPYLVASAQQIESPAQLYLQAGKELLDAEKLNDAIIKLDQAAKADPRNGWVFLNRSVALDKLHRKWQALEDADRAVSLLPTVPAAYSNRGAILLGLRRYKAALRDLNTAILFNSREGIFFENRALTYEALKDWRSAQADFKSAEFCYRDAGDEERAEKMHKRYMTLCHLTEGRKK